MRSILERFQALVIALAVCVSLVPNASKAEIAHAELASWFDALNGVGFIRACEQLRSGPDGQNWIGVDGLNEFFQTSVRQNSELLAKFTREVPTGMRQQAMAGDAQAMCVTWSMFINLGIFYDPGTDGWMYKGREYVFPLISIQDIMGLSRAEITAQYQPLLDAMGANDVNGGIEIFDALLEDSMAMGVIVDDLMELLAVSNRDGIVPAVQLLQEKVAANWYYQLAAAIFGLLALLFFVLWLLAQRSAKKALSGASANHGEALRNANAKHEAALRKANEQHDKALKAADERIGTLERENAGLKKIVNNLRLQLASVVSVLRTFGSSPMSLPAGLHYYGDPTIFVMKDGRVRLPGHKDPVSIAVAHETLRNSPEARSWAGVVEAPAQEERRAA